jgi:hypothetical protein
VDGWLTGNYPETGLEEINGDLLEAELAAWTVPNTARMFIDFRLGLRLHARNSR